MEFTLFTIIICLAIFVAGAFLGVLLGRRSKTANDYVDRIQMESDRLRERVRELEAKAKAKL